MNNKEKEAEQLQDKSKEVEVAVVPYRHDITEILKKSNKFIGAKYKSSVLENQVTYLAMLKIQKKDYSEEDGDIVVSMKASEIKEEIGNQSGSFYNALKQIADDMTTNNMGIIDDDNERFAFISLVSMATYNKGVFTLYFSKRLKGSLLDVINEKRGWTGIPKNVAMNLKNKFSFPLYQLLKQVCYYPSNYTGRKDYVFEYQIGLSELKLIMGVVNSNIPEVRKILNNSRGTNADYDRAVEKSPDKMYNMWYKFRSQCLEPTIEEINEKTDIHVEYEKNTRGRGGEVYGITFTIYLQGAEKNKDVTPVSVEDDEIVVKLTEEEKFVRVLEIGEVLNTLKLPYEDVIAVCEAANYDKETVCEEVNKLKAQGAHIANITGWLISAIKNNYSMPVTYENEDNKKSKAKNNAFLNFHQRDYDAEELEKIFLDISNN